MTKNGKGWRFVAALFFCKYSIDIGRKENYIIYR